MFLSYIILVVHVANCADILAIVPTPSYSHQVAFFDLWNGLSLRGHKVTLITTDPQRNKKLTNLTEIDVSDTYHFLADMGSFGESTMTSWNMHAWFHDKTVKIAEAQLQHPEVQDLIHGNDKRFDVLLLESFYLELLGFVEKFNCPVILISSLDVFAIIHRKLGNTAHPVLYPDIGDLHAPLNFRERITSTMYTLYTSLFYNYVSYPDKGLVLQKFFNSNSTAHQLLNKVDMLFLNVNPLLQSVRPVGPSTINIGGLRQISPKPLPKDISEFLEKGDFIYFSLGSNIKSKNLQKESLDAIVETFKELSYKVLWKFEAEADAIPPISNNVKLITWAPQLGILAHPNIKLFVTQGGLQSMEETIHSEVPCVVIPFIPEQQQNARLMTSKGIAVTVGRRPYINKEELKAAILEVINNPGYKNAVRRIKQLYVDVPMTSLEKAIWWTEYVIRNKGAKHLRNPAADLPFHQYYLLDVIAFLMVAAVVTLSVLFLILNSLYSSFTAMSSHGSNIVAKKCE